MDDPLAEYSWPTILWRPPPYIAYFPLINDRWTYRSSKVNSINCLEDFLRIFTLSKSLGMLSWNWWFTLFFPLFKCFWFSNQIKAIEFIFVYVYKYLNLCIFIYLQNLYIFVYISYLYIFTNLSQQGTCKAG